jgi:hypothetical protein
MLLRDFNTQSGLPSGFSGFWVVFGWFLGGFWVVFAKTTFGKIKSSGFSQPWFLLMCAKVMSLSTVIFLSPFVKQQLHTTSM